MFDKSKLPLVPANRVVGFVWVLFIAGIVITFGLAFNSLPPMVALAAVAAIFLPAPIGDATFLVSWFGSRLALAFLFDNSAYDDNHITYIVICVIGLVAMATARGVTSLTTDFHIKLGGAFVAALFIFELLVWLVAWVFASNDLLLAQRSLSREFVFNAVVCFLLVGLHLWASRTPLFARTEEL